MFEQDRMRLEAIAHAKDRASRGDHCKVYFAATDDYGRENVWFVRVEWALPPKNSIVIFDTRNENESNSN